MDGNVGNPLTYITVPQYFGISWYFIRLSLVVAWYILTQKYNFTIVQRKPEKAKK